MGNVVQQLAKKINMSCDEFIGEMRKRGCSRPTAIKIWHGDFEEFKDFNDNDVYLSNLRKAADVLKVTTGSLLPKQVNQGIDYYKLRLHNQEAKG